MWFPTESADFAYRTLRGSSAHAGKEEQGQRGPYSRSRGKGNEGTKEKMSMATTVDANVEKSVVSGRDRIVRRLDEYPELKKALRNGDVPTGRYLCAQLFSAEASPLAMRAKA